MYRIIANTVFIIIAYIVLASTSLIPSGIPSLSYRKYLSILAQKSSTVNGNTSEHALPSSPVYEYIKDIKTKEPKKNSNSTIILLIVLESLGLTLDPKIDDWMVDTFQSKISNLSHKYPHLEMRIREADYSLGGTLGAELRYLCNFRSKKYLNQFRIMPSREGLPNACLPELFLRKGYKTYYIHNGSPSFYRRNTIMPLIGFSEIRFQSSNARTFARCISKPFCGSDAVSYSQIKSILKHYLGNADKSNKGLFLNLMTIDTHAPYISKNGPLEGFKQQFNTASENLFIFLDWLYSQNTIKGDIYVILTSDHQPGGLPIDKKYISKPSTADGSSNHRKTNFVYEIYADSR